MLPDWVTADARVDVEIRWDMGLPSGPIMVGDGQACDGWSLRIDYNDRLVADGVTSRFDEGPMSALRHALAEAIDTDAHAIQLQICGYAAIFTEWRDF